MHADADSDQRKHSVKNRCCRLRGCERPHPGVTARPLQRPRPLVLEAGPGQRRAGHREEEPDHRLLVRDLAAGQHSPAQVRGQDHDYPAWHDMQVTRGCHPAGLDARGIWKMSQHQGDAGRQVVFTKVRHILSGNFAISVCQDGVRLRSERWGHCAWNNKDGQEKTSQRLDVSPGTVKHKPQIIDFKSYHIDPFYRSLQNNHYFYTYLWNKRFI